MVDTLPLYMAPPRATEHLQDSSLFMPHDVQQKNRQFFVPRTASDWTDYQAEITRLYSEKNLPLREVQRIMETKYNFKATKRMYNTRLKQWKICKNYRAAEKEALAAQIAEAHLLNLPIDDIKINDRPVKLDRIIRHQKAKERAARDQFKINKQRNRNRRAGSEDSDSSLSDRDMTVVYSPEARRHLRTPPSSSSSGGSSTAGVTPGSSQPTDSEDSLSPDRHSFYGYGSQSNSPCPPIAVPKDQPNIELILRSAQFYYYNYVYSTLPNFRDPLDPAPVFWDKVKSAIYFSKKQSLQLALPLIDEACALADAVLCSVPLLFLNGLFTVLSPVNTAICPEIRAIVLSHVASMAAFRLTPTHPLAIICQELVKDQTCRKTSETAVKATLDVFIATLGHDHKDTFAVQRSLVSLLRRDRDYEGARRLSERLVASTQQALINQRQQQLLPSPSALTHTELCIAQTELVHIHVATANYALARDLAAAVLDNYKAIQGASYPDSRAAYAMEDLAEIHQLQGDVESAIGWLREAFDASCMLRGRDDPATVHVKDKLQALLCAKGRFEESAQLDLSLVEGAGLLSLEDLPAFGGGSGASSAVPSPMPVSPLVS